MLYVKWRKNLNFKNMQVIFSNFRIILIEKQNWQIFCAFYFEYPGWNWFQNSEQNRTIDYRNLLQTLFLSTLFDNIPDINWHVSSTFQNRAFFDNYYFVMN